MPKVDFQRGYDDRRIRPYPITKAQIGPYRTKTDRQQGDDGRRIKP